MKGKPDVTGIVTHVSRKGTEVHLLGDPKRYRGARLAHPGDPKCKTYNVFRHVNVGDTVRLVWGGFANMNIVLCLILKRSGLPPKRPYTQAELDYRSRPNIAGKMKNTQE